tara:strand:- start:1364 stop:1816 length:453 start_codon:yes stop_codon:yes gene_type:complete
MNFSNGDNYNNDDIRIGAFSKLDISAKVNVNYVLDSVKDWNDDIDDVCCEELAWQINYIENLNNEKSESFWEDFNYNFFNREWERDISIVNMSLSIGYEGQDESEVFVEMIRYLFDGVGWEDNDCDWGFDSEEEKQEYLKKNINVRLEKE